jgi:hypothetical protein
LRNANFASCCFNLLCYVYHQAVQFVNDFLQVVRLCSVVFSVRTSVL